MGEYVLYALGFFAQGLFGARLLVQVFLSQREGRSVSPTLFWLLSLLASFLFLIYGVLRSDPVIVLGQTLSYFIYIRNLQLKDAWKSFPLAIRIIAFALPAVVFGWMVMSPGHVWQRIISQADITNFWIVLGGVGQLMLNFRFVYQWYYSERAGTSALPLGFWVISAVASVMVILYALFRPGGIDPVLLLAQGLGIFVYARNILFFRSGAGRGEL
ncbi:MAG: lipid-A-disaccharide synthase N-terminal domain-containing protein [Cyclobacteriaceae bacterium]|jgi:lipid-A-disaccharide synthase-like uncharacterized protein|nr:lipid-A-disaccharide synthase N-terminal domain-containing protein [Flammeovirgaceae bacterium]